MAFQQQFKMQCAKGHRWIETYPTGHTQFGDCPKCPGRTKGRVLVMADVQEVETHISEGVSSINAYLLDVEPWLSTTMNLAVSSTRRIRVLLCLFIPLVHD